MPWHQWARPWQRSLNSSVSTRAHQGTSAARATKSCMHVGTWLELTLGRTNSFRQVSATVIRGWHRPCSAQLLPTLPLNEWWIEGAQAPPSLPTAQAKTACWFTTAFRSKLCSRTRSWRDWPRIILQVVCWWHCAHYQLMNSLVKCLWPWMHLGQSRRPSSRCPSIANRWSFLSTSRATTRSIKFATSLRRLRWHVLWLLELSQQR